MKEVRPFASKHTGFYEVKEKKREKKVRNSLKVRFEKPPQKDQKLDPPKNLKYDSTPPSKSNEENKRLEQSISPFRLTGSGGKSSSRPFRTLEKQCENPGPDGTLAQKAYYLNSVLCMLQGKS